MGYEIMILEILPEGNSFSCGRWPCARPPPPAKDNGHQGSNFPRETHVLTIRWHHLAGGVRSGGAPIRKGADPGGRRSVTTLIRGGRGSCRALRPTPGSAGASPSRMRRTLPLCHTGGPLANYSPA